MDPGGTVGACNPQRSQETLAKGWDGPPFFEYRLPKLVRPLAGKGQERPPNRAHGGETLLRIGCHHAEDNLFEVLRQPLHVHAWRLELTRRDFVDDANAT